eukprot:scaffold34257_cov17-Tisochrysis_lutea.AAC.1
MGSLELQVKHQPKQTFMSGSFVVCLPQQHLPVQGSEILGQWRQRSCGWSTGWHRCCPCAKQKIQGSTALLLG